MTLSDVAELTLLSWDTVKNIVKAALAKDYGKPVLKGVRYLGIDEIHLGKTHRFYTIVIDLEDGRILWARPGRGKAALRGFWRRLRLAKARIKAVAIDMSGAYWSAVLEREAEGPLKMKIKGTRFLLLRNPKNLADDQIPKLDEALRLNEPLLLAWYLKEELRELWNQTSHEQMKAFLKNWCDKASQTGIGQMHKMAKTLRTHLSGILAYADHPITSAKLEGINNKIKTLTKRSYGFHDQNFFILKLLSLHHSKYKLLG
jgi:transposase